MTLEQSHNLQSSRSNSPNKRTLISNKITNSQGCSSSSSSSIIDERLTSHLDACARASKVRDRVSLLMHRCHNNSKETQLHALYGMGNTCINKKSMTKTTKTRTTTCVANFDKDRFQKLMTKRKSLARMQTNACSKSWKIKNVHHANEQMNWSLDQEHVTSTLNSINNPQHKQSHTSSFSSSSSSYPNNGYNGNQNQPCDIQNRSKVTRDHHSVILGHNNIQPNCELKLKDLEVRFNHVPTTCTSSLQAVKKTNISPRQRLDTSLDQSLHCITIDGDDEKYCGQDGNNGHDDYDDDLLTLRSNASYLDAMEYSEDVHDVSFSSVAMISRDGEGNNGSKERMSSKRSIKHLRSGDSNGVNYLTQLQTLIGIQENDDGTTNRKAQNVNIKSTCNILVGNGDTTTSKAIADPFANSIHDSLKNIDHDLASIVSSQITFDGNHDKDHQHPSQTKLGKGTNCSLLRLCLMVWFISLVLIYERSWSREIYLLSSWRRIVEQSVKEAIDLQMQHLENMVALRSPQSKSLNVTINALEAVSCIQPYSQKPVTVTPVAIDEVQTAMKYQNDTVALFDNLLHRHDGSKRRLVGEYNLPTGSVRTSDTCGIDSIFYRDMMLSLSSEEEYVRFKQIGMDSTLILSDHVEDMKWQQKNDALNVSTIIRFSESNSKISKGPFWSSRKYIPFLSHDFVPYAGIHDSTLTSNLSRSFSTEKKSSHRILHGQPSFLDMHSYKPLEYLHGRHSLDDEDDVSILDIAIDFFRITIKAWKQKRQIRK